MPLPSNLTIFKLFHNTNTFLPMILQSITFIFKYSPEFILVNRNNQHEFQIQQSFILQLLNASTTFNMIIVGLSTIYLKIVTFLFIALLFSIFFSKKGILFFQIISNILFPIQAYLTVTSINANLRQTSYFCITLMYIFIKFIEFHFQQHISKFSCQILDQIHYSLLKLLGIFIRFCQTLSWYQAVFYHFYQRQQLIDDNCFIVIADYNKRINFESPLMEYTAYLCEPLSWISILTIFYMRFYSSNISIMLWIYSGFVFIYLYRQNELLRYILERKYTLFLQKQCVLALAKMSQKDVTLLEQKFIAYLSIVKQVLKVNDHEAKKQCFLKFSDSFVHLIYTFIVKMDDQLLNRQANLNTEQNLQEQKTKFSKNALCSINNSCQSLSRMNINLIDFIKQGIFEFKSPSQENQRWWSIIKSLKQVQNYKTKRLRRYICYTLPQINNLFQTRIIYLYYLSYQKDINEEKLCCQDNSIISNLHRQIDYDFVMERNKNKYFNQFLTKTTKKHPTLINPKKQFQYDNCLHLQAQYGSSYYEGFYKQTIIQQTLQKQFLSFANIQQAITSIIQSSESTVHDLVPYLLKINKVKNKISSTLYHSSQAQNNKHIIQHYILSRYILKLPSIARQELKALQELRQQREFQNKIKFNPHKISSKSLNRVGQIQNHGVFMISSVQKKGNILYACDSFRQIMQIKSKFNLTNQVNYQSLNMNHLMLPMWVQNHNQAMSSLQIYQKPFHHLSQKYHIKSLISKNIYEVSFTVHFITCNKEDLIIAMDAVYCKLDYLAIYHKNQKIFCRDVVQVRRRNSSIRGQLIANSLQRNSLVPQYCQIDSIHRYDENIFGQNYKLIVKYNSQNQDDKIQTMTLMSFLEEQQKLQSQADHFQGIQIEKKLQTQHKLNNYRKKHFLLTKDFTYLLLINVATAFVLIILLSIVSNILNRQNNKHLDFYDFKHSVENQFFITDLKSSNSFFMLFAVISPYVNFPSNQSILNFNNIWYQIFMEEVNTLSKRSYQINQNPSFIGFMTQLAIKSQPDGHQTSLLYGEQLLDVNFFDILSKLSINSIQQNNLSSFPNPKKVLNMIQLNQLVAFYLKSLYRYDDYMQQGGIFDGLQTISKQMMTQEDLYVRLIYLLMLILILVGTVFFAFFYLRYFTLIYRFISSVFQLPSNSIRYMKTCSQNLKELIQQIKQTSEINPYKTIQTSRTIGFKNKTIFIRTNHPDHNKIMQPKYYPFRQNWIKIFYLILFITCFFIILRLGQRQANRQIQLFDRYLQGSSKLTQLLAKSIYIFTQLMDIIFSTTRLLNPQVPGLIKEIKQIDRLKIMQMIEPDKIEAQSYLFRSWVNVTLSSQSNSSHINFMSTKTLMETISKSILLYQQVYHKLYTGSQTTVIDSELVVKMYKQLSSSTQMIRQLLNQAEYNYFRSTPNVNTILFLNGVWIVIFCVLIMGWGFVKLYLKTKLVFEEILSLTHIKDLLCIPTLAVHIRHSQKQNIVGNY